MLEQREELLMILTALVSNPAMSETDPEALLTAAVGLWKRFDRVANHLEQE